MSETCDIIFDGHAVGRAKISRVGLYYSFDCLCRFPAKDIYRLRAQCENRIVDLGICVPQGDSFGLCTKIPFSRLGEGKITVFAKSREEPVREQVLPVDKDKPFSRLEDLDNAVLCDASIIIKG